MKFYINVLKQLFMCICRRNFDEQELDLRKYVADDVESDNRFLAFSE